jgi:hypothetical protein
MSASLRPAALALALALCGCAQADPPAAQESAPESAQEPEPPRSWPPGTVLAVEDLPILAEEVDRASVIVQRIERRAVDAQLRRLALTNVVLPRALLRLLGGERRDAALAEARDALQRLRSGTWVGPTADGLFGQMRGGSFFRLGLELWAAGTDLPEGAWSEPIEQDGAFHLVRRIALRPSPVPLGVEVDLDVLTFPFLEEATRAHELEAAYDRYRLTVDDPAWRELVPELLLYRMGARTP